MKRLEALTATLCLVLIAMPGRLLCGDPGSRAGSRVEKAVDEYRQSLHLQLTGPTDGPAAVPSDAPAEKHEGPTGQRSLDRAVDDYKKVLALSLRGPDE